ncbi:MAG: radical SAM protein [Gemmatimonadota bacterium]|nr:MAG: radical SAM protein [Gemmatimonadota bacterium]
MHELRIGVIDLVTKGPNRALYARVMHANLASIMPQVVAHWCEELGHDVTFVCFTGRENLVDELPSNVDLVFIGAFTQSAQLAYALSNLFRFRGAVTILGGPHARCYPEDSCKYFDYVLGFTDKNLIDDVLRDHSPNRPVGRFLTAERQPQSLPGVRERWKYIKPTLEKAPLIKIVPMLGSLGCPYDCSFCIDSEVPYLPLDLETLKHDLRFLLTRFRRPRVAWHDPNFGVQFNAIMDAIEQVAPPDTVDFIAESSLSLLSEKRLKRLRRNGFKAMLPGIESWYDLGNKSKTGGQTGSQKVRRVSEHVNLIMEYVPYVQTNFVLGLDVDEGVEPFQLTKEFVDKSPGAFPGYSLLSGFGRAAPLNLDYQRDGRILPFPFHFLNNNHAMNVRPKNYSWGDFYDHVIDLTRHTFSWRSILRRYRAVKTQIPKWMNVVRAVSSEGFGRIKYYSEVRRRLESDLPFRRYFEGDTTELPEFFLNRVRADLGPLWQWLPRGALQHDSNAYLKSVDAPVPAQSDVQGPEPAGAAVGDQRVPRLQGWDLH